MKLLIHNSNPPKARTRGMTLFLGIAWGLFAALLAAIAILLCVQILREDGSTAGQRIGSVALVVLLFAAILITLLGSRFDGQRSHLEIEGERVTIHTYPMLVHQQRSASLRDVRGFRSVCKGFRRGQPVQYIGAVNEGGEVLFELLDCPENRRWMEQLTRLPCEI